MARMLCFQKKKEAEEELVLVTLVESLRQELEEMDRMSLWRPPLWPVDL